MPRRPYTYQPLVSPSTTTTNDIDPLIPSKQPPSSSLHPFHHSDDINSTTHSSTITHRLTSCARPFCLFFRDCCSINFIQAYQQLQEHYPQLHPRIAGVYIAGILFSIGWWLFIDGLVYHVFHFPGDQPIQPGFEDWAPGLVASLSLIMLNIVPKQLLFASDFGYDGCCVAGRARLWFFISMVLLASSLGGSAAVFVIKYQQQSAATPLGGYIIAQNVFLFVSAVLCWIARNYGSQDESYTI